MHRLYTRQVVGGDPHPFINTGVEECRKYASALHAVVLACVTANPLKATAGNALWAKA
jgi:hypothetical protein